MGNLNRLTGGCLTESVSRMQENLQHGGSDNCLLDQLRVTKNPLIGDRSLCSFAEFSRAPRKMFVSFPYDFPEALVGNRR